MYTIRVDVKNTTRNVRAARSFAFLQITFLALVVCVGLAAWLLVLLQHWLRAPQPVDASILLPVWRSLLNPEPVERLTFLVLASTLPIVAYVIALARVNEYPRLSERCSLSIVFIVAIAFLVPFVRFTFGSNLLTGVIPKGTHPAWTLCWSVAAAALLLSIVRADRTSIIRRYTPAFAWSIFLTLSLLQLLSWRLLNVNSITEGTTWWMSADAVVFSVSQAVAGRTLIADLPSQYGLFGEFLAPLFKLVGLSVFSLSALFGVMQIASLLAIFSVSQRILRHPLFVIGFGIAFVMVTYETCLFLIGYPELYFQYWPVRFFWPALSVFVFYRYTQRPALSRATLVSLTGALGSLWNADSGLMIEIAFAAFLVAKWGALFVGDRNKSALERRTIISNILLHLAVLVVVITVAMLYLSSKADRPLEFDWLIGYQQLFYGLGFMMLPLPLRPSPWMSVVGVYLLSILLAATIWSQSPRNRVADFLLYVGMLGIGLFVYYQGRSHILNLITVSWPALLIATIMADRIARASAARILPRFALAPATVVGGVIIVCSLAFMQGIPTFFAAARSTFKNWSTPASSIVHDEMDFIAANSKKGEPCVILSKRQGLYYASLGLASPLVGPGYMEMLTVRDRDSMIDQLQKRPVECLFIGERDSVPELGVDLISKLDAYRVVKTNTFRTMAKLVPR